MKDAINQIKVSDLMQSIAAAKCRAMIASNESVIARIAAYRDYLATLPKQNGG